MFGFGFSEIFLVFLIVLILFGAKKIPQLGSGLGEGIKNFTKSFKETTVDENEVKKEEEEEEDSAADIKKTSETTK